MTAFAKWDFMRAALAAAGTLCLALTGCGKRPATIYPGYVEGEYV